MPLSHYLKQFFATEKKYGSKDRKQIVALCYNYYRLGKVVQDISTEERIILATFLCGHDSSDFLAFHHAGWNEKINTLLAEKLLIINYQLLSTDIFPYSPEISAGIAHEQFSASFLHQPDLFLRIRPGKKDIALNKLETAGLKFQLLSEDCVVLPNSSKIDTVLETDKEVVVQDANSQKVLDFLRPYPLKVGSSHSIWDCCAASGGKSILAYDILQGKLELTVSDIRESILSNLKKRFKTAGINNYHSFVADLNTSNCQLPTANCQVLICDVPCTGSGTWSRTPEQLYFFDPGTITFFADRQKKIVSNAIPHLQKDGLFFYITCSVFKKENEDIVDFIKEKFHLHLLQMGPLKGYDTKADSMFVAVLCQAGS